MLPFDYIVLLTILSNRLEGAIVLSFANSHASRFASQLLVLADAEELGGRATRLAAPESDDDRVLVFEAL